MSRSVDSTVFHRRWNVLHIKFVLFIRSKLLIQLTVISMLPVFSFEVEIDSGSHTVISALKYQGLVGLSVNGELL